MSQCGPRLEDNKGPIKVAVPAATPSPPTQSHFLASMAIE
jgi:hypothetical protein